jgi:mono/diheme cytochrome c family protein
MVKRLASACLTLVIATCLWTIHSAADEPGRQVYEDKCSRCHGDEGRGGTGPRLVPFQWSEQRALELVRNPECDMPPIPASEVNDAQVAQIVEYLKTIK